MGNLASRLKSVVDCLLACHPRQAEEVGSDGARAEQMAARHLRTAGLTILARNFRGRGGEIDLIAEHRGTIVFVEVRLRQHGDFGGAAASISPAKRGRIVRTAREWLQTDGNRFAGRPSRFDAVLLDRLDERSVTWLQGAFAADRTV